MRYYSFLIFLVAASVCFTPHRRNDESPSSHEKQLGRTDDVHINQVHGNRDRLIEDIRVCGQFLNGLNALSTEFKSNSSLLNFVEACERVVVVLDRAVDRSLHRVQSPEQRNLPGLVRRDWLYSAEDEIPGTTASAFFKEDSPSDASTLECTFLKTERQNAERKYRRWEEICEEKVCAIENLDKICQAETIDPSAAQTCKMCYPEENAQLINSHCQAKWGIERKAFYVVSFVLIGVTLISGLILYIRRRYLRAKNSHADEFTTNGSGINPPGELYYYDGPRSIMPSEIQSSLSSLAVNCSPEPSEYEDTKTHPSSWDDNEDGVISTSVAQRRLKQLGILSKTRRKRVHDLFDLEALQSKRGTTKSSQQHSNEMDRVPVMPWAPNASNRYSTRFSSHVRPTARSESPPGVESREMPRIPRTVP